MYRQTSLSVQPKSDKTEGPCHRKTNEQNGTVESIIPARERIGSVLNSWRIRGKVRKYIEQTDVAIALSKLNEGVKNIIKEYLNGTQFDEKKHQKNINKARNIVDNWEDGFPIRKNKAEAYLKEKLELNNGDFLDLKKNLPKGILTILKYLTVMRMFNKEIKL